MKCTFQFMLIGLMSVVLAGCTEEQVKTKGFEVPKVEVSLPETRTVSDFEDFTGRFDAIYTVEIRARVTGYLDKVQFADGIEVEKDDLLFEIDPRPYETELHRTTANLLQSEARQRRLDADQRRANNLYSRSAIGREEYDRIIGDFSEAQAAVDVSKAALEMAKLSLEFTKVKAPIAGRLSRRLVDPGNMVQADVTPLTTIVSLDPLYVYFEVDERTLLRLRRLAREGKIPTRSSGAVISIMVGLADELEEDTGDFLFPHQGEIDFSDNKVDAATGTLQLRGKIPNPKSPAGTRVLSPGLFAHVRLPVGDPHPAVLIPEQALARDQGQRVVYGFQPTPTGDEGAAKTKAQNKDTEVGKASGKNAENVMLGEVFRRPVRVKPYSKGMMVIEQGLKEGEMVVVSGLQRIKDKMAVRAVKVKPEVQVSASKSMVVSE
jgi:multidrug efflux system membrane fusion protein